MLDVDVLEALAHVEHVLSIDVYLFKVLEVFDLFFEYLQVVCLPVFFGLLEDPDYLKDMWVRVVHNLNLFYLFTILSVYPQELCKLLLQPHVIVRRGGPSTELRVRPLGVHVGIHEIHVVVVVLQKHSEDPLLQLLLEVVLVNLLEKVILYLQLGIV